jgi:ribosomal protein S18 acetylase RimI-like enzyme
MPQLQGGGIGKKLLSAAEDHAKETGYRKIYMSVISVRTELIDWYKRHGYTDTGKTIFFSELEESGKHLQPLDFLIMEKVI